MFNLLRTATSLRAQGVRMATRAMSQQQAQSLKSVLAAQVPKRQEELKKLKADHGEKSLGEVTVEQCIGGARSVKCMLWDTSLLDAEEGIRFRGYSIPEIQQKLPTAKGPAGTGEPLPEALMWLLLTSEIPTKEQAASITQELRGRARLPAHVEPLIRSFPKGMHPMTQFSMAIMAMQTDSHFAKAYAKGVSKSEYWQHTLEDILNLVARLPEVAALIYRCSFKDGAVNKKEAASLDWSAGFARMLGYNTAHFDELMRLYLCIHADHEGGNASAHALRLVGSTLSDPYLAASGAMNALAGPLHGLANQEVLKWIMDLKAEFDAQGKPVNKDTITEFAWATLNSGKVIPGYGHAVLRRTDPRYTCQREFALKYLPNDPLFKVVDTIFQVMPDILTKHGKTKNPYPNVDSHSGVLLWHYGFKEFEYYTVLFGVSRIMGASCQLFWDRALGLPLERPKSVTSQWINKYFASK